MERDGLGRLSRAELLEMIRRHHEALAERDAAIERRDENIRELEVELAQFRRDWSHAGPSGRGSRRC